jgi:hypothetical protein
VDDLNELVVRMCLARGCHPCVVFGSFGVYKSIPVKIAYTNKKKLAKKYSSSTLSFLHCLFVTTTPWWRGEFAEWKGLYSWLSHDDVIVR